MAQAGGVPNNMSNPRRIYLYDTTLRDGAQTFGVDFTTADKYAIAIAPDNLGIDYIEGGWPGANPTDDAFFADAPPIKNAKFTAFGMTHKASHSAANDPSLAALINANTSTICIVGKSWDFHVEKMLAISLSENLEVIKSTIKHIKNNNKEALFDAEHFFDGYKNNPEYAISCLKSAHEAGADWLVLCDTNGGTLPHEITQIINIIGKDIPFEKIGIHCHNDTENAVANSLAAVKAGASMIQGTLNGLGERCGNANLISLIPSLKIKMGFDIGIDDNQLKELTSISHILDERLNRAPLTNAPYVGKSAFAHKGGLHVSAVLKSPQSYEHIKPETIGNQRQILMSDQAGRANIKARLKEIGLDTPKNSNAERLLLEDIKDLESQGYAFDEAGASFELLARRRLSHVPEYFKLISFRLLDERRGKADNRSLLSEATTKIKIENKEYLTVAEGNGPVNALDAALRKALIPYYPALSTMRLIDYKVRIMPAPANTTGTDAITRVMIESADDHGHFWTTIGVSENIIDASYNALRDALIWRLFKEGL